MKFLFYVEPLIERGKPYWKEGWANQTSLEIVKTLQQSGDEYSFALITNEAIAQTMDPSKITIHTLSQEELLRPFDTDYSSAIKSWHMQTYSQEQLEYYQELMHSKLRDFIPDIILTFTPVPFLRTLFPNALILHHEFSLFSRLPYLESWFLDPVGVTCNSFLDRFSEEISNNKLSIEQKKYVENFKELCQHTFSEKTPFTAFFADKREKYDFLVLLPLQFSGYYLFDDLVPFKSQYEYCVYVLDHTPHSVGVVVNMHPENPVLGDDAIKFLTSKYPHFIYSNDFDTIYASGQFILPFVDGVVSVSSSIALQALLFNKKIITVGKTCFTYIADALSLENIEHTLTCKAKDKDTILFYMLTQYTITSKYMYDPLWLNTFLKRSLDRFRTQGIDAHFYNQIDEIEPIFNHLNETLQNNAHTVPQYRSMPVVQLFFDFGTGISTENFLTIPVTQESTQRFSFDLKKHVFLRSLRLDPLDDNCVIEIESFLITTDLGETDVSNQLYSNACFTDNKTYYFESHDPQLFFVPKDEIFLHTAKKLILVIHYLYIGREALEHILHNQTKFLSSKEAQINALTCELKTKQDETNALTCELQAKEENIHALLQSKSWKITAPLRTINRFFKRYPQS